MALRIKYLISLAVIIIFNSPIIDAQNNIWTNYTTNDGLVNNRVMAIAIDTLGNKCFGTDEGASKWTSGNTGTKDFQIKENISDVLVYPNPFNSSTEIYINSEFGNLIFHIEIYNSLGKKVREIQNINYKAVIERKGLSAGIYIYKVSVSKNFLAAGKLVIK
ncbi:T9SS type A sorting domain-containing protein [Candidatus Amoebophilus asiaticus]|nr:T9SS type A sorting domain-containing protein [Candidatus Amoebophilus asiaticus]